MWIKVNHKSVCNSFIFDKEKEGLKCKDLDILIVLLECIKNILIDSIYKFRFYHWRLNAAIKNPCKIFFFIIQSLVFVFIFNSTIWLCRETKKKQQNKNNAKYHPDHWLDICFIRDILEHRLTIWQIKLNFSN